MAGKAVSTNDKKLRAIMGEAVACPWHERIRMLLRSALSHLVVYNFAPKAKNSMCIYYGHIVDHSKWRSNSLPQCQDCGKQVSSASELRASFVKTPEAPPDSQIVQFKYRKKQTAESRL